MFLAVTQNPDIGRWIAGIIYKVPNDESRNKLVFSPPYCMYPISQQMCPVRYIRV